MTLNTLAELQARHNGDYASLGNPFLHSFSTFSTTGLDPWTLAVLCFLGHVDLSLVYGVQN